MYAQKFMEFINRPYTKLLKLDSGETIEMPNVVRTVTRSTMISQYIQFCQEEKFEPLSRSSLFKMIIYNRSTSMNYFI